MRKSVRFIFRLVALVIPVMIAVMGGCTSAKKLVYFQGSPMNGDTITMLEPFVNTIKKGDVLSIQISSINPEAAAIFNPTSRADEGGSNPNNPLARLSGYLVDEDGTIKLPIVGKIAVFGLTTARASDVIGDRIKTYLKEPTVSVRNLNFHISVLGEVARPALFTIPTERITIPEALGLAGDLTIYGRRDNVMVIREEGNKRVFARLDLTHRTAFQSPFYSLRPNDIVYVEPGKARATSVDRAYQLAPVLIGILSIVAIILTRP